MDAAKVKRNLVFGYGAGILLLIIPITIAIAVCGQDRVYMGLKGMPMFLVDVVVMAAILASVMVHVCITDGYRISSVFRMERKKYYVMRMKILRICRSASVAIALAFKFLVMDASGEIDGISLGHLVWYWIAVGVFYAGVMALLVLLLDLIPITLVTVAYFFIPFLLLFVSMAKPMFPVIQPSNTVTALILGALCCILDVVVTSVHKKHYETMDCH